MKLAPSRTVLALAGVLVTAACSTTAGSGGPTPLVLALPTVRAMPAVCLGVGGGATLVGDPRDKHVVWAEGFGNRAEIVWPPGYVARFGARLEILGPAGQVVLREGDALPDGCAVGPADNPPSVVLIVPEPTGQ